MPHPNSLLTDGRPKTVGSFGKLKELLAADPQTVGKSCDLAEVRLDLIASEFNIGDTPPWCRVGRDTARCASGDRAGSRC